MEEQFYNSALIAAAPELLEALETLLPVFDDNDSVKNDWSFVPVSMRLEDIRKANALIKKAKGE